jgi:hypothetical protein
MDRVRGATECVLIEMERKANGRSLGRPGTGKNVPCSEKCNYMPLGVGARKSISSMNDVPLLSFVCVFSVSSCSNINLIYLSRVFIARVLPGTKVGALLWSFR